MKELTAKTTITTLAVTQTIELKNDDFCYLIESQSMSK